MASLREALVRGSLTSLVLCAGLAPLASADEPLAVDETIRGPFDDENNQFGRALAIDGDFMVVGDPFYEEDTSGRAEIGRARVYRYVGGDWILSKTLDGDNFDDWAYFGWSVDVYERPLTGDAWVIVGANGLWGTDEAAEIWYYDAGSDDWSPQDTITDPTGTHGDEFGHAVAIHGGYAIVGAPGKDTALGTESGAVLLFEYDGGLGGAGSWDFVEEYVDEIGPAMNGTRFGDALDLGGQYFAVSSEYGYPVSLFKRFSSSWHAWQNIKPLFPSSTRSLALDGETLAIGAPHEGPGAVSVWTLGDEYWEELGSVTPPDGAANDFFGFSVALEDDTLLVGSPFHDVDGIEGSGKVYVYDAEDLSECGTFENPEPEEQDWFGQAVAVHDECQLAVGAPGDDLADLKGSVRLLGCIRGPFLWDFLDPVTGTPFDLRWPFAVGETKDTGEGKGVVWEEHPDLGWVELLLPDLGGPSRATACGGQTGEEILAGTAAPPVGELEPVVWTRSNGQWLLEVLAMPQGAALPDVHDVERLAIGGAARAVAGTTTAGATVWITAEDDWETPIVLPPLPGGGPSAAMAIDDIPAPVPALFGWAENGQGVRRPVRWIPQGQGYVVLPMPPLENGGPRGEAHDVFRSAEGHVVVLGRAEDATGALVPVAWELRDGAWEAVVLSTEGAPHLHDLEARAMAQGDVAGMILGRGLDAGGESRAVVWSPLAAGAEVFDLTELLAAELGQQGEEIAEIRGVAGWSADHLALSVTLVADPSGAEYPLIVELTTVSDAIGEAFCGPAELNSVGLSAEISARGSLDVDQNDVTLEAAGMPPYQFGYFLVSAVPNDPGIVPPGSEGRLCLGAPIGRYNETILNSYDTGSFELAIDLTALPLVPTHVVQPGETWHFQGWYRDVNANQATSNFTDAIGLTFE